MQSNAAYAHCLREPCYRQSIRSCISTASSFQRAQLLMIHRDGSAPPAFSMNQQIHAEIARLTGNPVLQTTWAALTAKILRARSLAAGSTPPFVPCLLHPARDRARIKHEPAEPTRAYRSSTRPTTRPAGARGPAKLSGVERCGQVSDRLTAITDQVDPWRTVSLVANAPSFPLCYL